MRPGCLLAAVPARSHHPSLPPRFWCLSLSPCSPGAGYLLSGTVWLGKESKSSQPDLGRCWREQPHPITPRPGRRVALLLTWHLTPAWQKVPGKADHLSPAMPHFLDWFVPVYLMISILILVGFGACIYYFEPGLQEAHKWRTQRPIMERDLRKTLMIRDNLAFGVPEV
ncbi:small integral membrane protein 45 [Heliangelus exortis]|uniref:small integral membrane protein 45 n=1 Tax=Heliangelus exortis TaxID=472823 RepID=UPI003A8D8488